MKFPSLKELGLAYKLWRQDRIRKNQSEIIDSCKGDITPPFLSNFERGQSPKKGLDKIKTIFDSSGVDDFFEFMVECLLPIKGLNNIVYLGKEEQRRIELENGASLVRFRRATMKDHPIRVDILTIPPQKSTGKKSHDGCEFVLLMSEARVKMRFSDGANETSHTLEKGEAITFSSQLSHNFENQSNSDAVLVIGRPSWSYSEKEDLRL